MKVEVLLPTIERWHCIDLVLNCLGAAEKPDDYQILAVVQAGDKFKQHVEQRLKEINPRTRVIQRTEEGFDHDALKKGYNETGNWVSSQAQNNKIREVHLTYAALQKHADPTADYYWIMEDDTLFPLDFYIRALAAMKALRSDAVAGVSYRWRTRPPENTNFCRINREWVSGDKNNLPIEKVSFPRFPVQPSGVVKLGMTGLSGLVCKKECVQTWRPQHIPEFNSGADVSFSLNMEKNGFKFHGCWDLTLPHIIKSKTDNGFEILGKIDESLIPVLGANNERNV